MAASKRLVGETDEQYRARLKQLRKVERQMPYRGRWIQRFPSTAERVAAQQKKNQEPGE